jgi:hypothetical protein
MLSSCEPEIHSQFCTNLQMPGANRRPPFRGSFLRFNASTFERLPFQTCNLPESLLSFPCGLLIQ